MLNNEVDSFNFQINIRRGCWSKALNTATELASKVFCGVNLSNTEILLDNHYPGYSRQPTLDAICSYICSSCRFRCACSCDHGTNHPDHSKEILVKCDGDPVFYLVGSSNFSKTTYMTKDRNINQTDIAFIKYSDSTKFLIYSILKRNDNVLLRSFAELLDISNGNLSDNQSDFYSTYIESTRAYIVTAPYIGSDDILSEYTN